MPLNMALRMLVRRVPMRFPSAAARLLCTTSSGNRAGQATISGYDHFKTIAVTEPADAVLQARGMQWEQMKQGSLFGACVCRAGDLA